MKKLFAYVQPYLKSMALVVCLVFAQVMAELQMPNLMSNIVNNGVSTGDTSYIIQVGMQMLVVALIATACSISASFFSGRNALGVARDLRIGIFRKVESFSQMEFDKISTSSLITRTTNDVQQMQMIILSSQRMFVSSPLNFVGALINAMNKDAQLVRILFIAIPCVVAVVISVQRRAVPLFSLGQRKIDRLNQVLREGLSGVRVIRAFHREDYQSQRFNEANFDLTANSIRVQRIMATNWPMMMLVINSATIAVVWFGARNINAGFIRIGDLMAFTQYLSTILFSLMNLSMMFVSIPRAQVSANRIAEILNTEPLIQDPEAPTSLPTLLNPKQGLQVVFNDVTFRYPGGENPALRNISFTANSGETVAIIGSTGSGKTTIANLIMRFYDVEEGTVTVDGIDVRHLTLSDLRHQIGFIPQKAVLFSGAIADNLLYGNETATEAMRWEALRIAQAEDFVSALPTGEEAFVSQNGSNFSGGQKQRLSIARALVRKPRLYIFDDSFSALDYRTDVSLRQALYDETNEATKLIIAQRVSTIMQADQIIVLDEGRVVGIGTHRELLETCQVYQEIVRSQLSEAEIA